MAEMDRSWLVQRLNAPFGEHALLGRDNPFAFGGGYKNGGLSDEAMGLLRGIFSFDYMGAAEFEFGAVPEALQRVAKAADAGLLEAWTLGVLLSKVREPWREEANPPAPRQKGMVYVLAPAEWKAEVEDRITGWAVEKRPKDQPWKYQLKEHTNLAMALRPAKDQDWFRTAGWLELDNGFFFFTSESMWRATADLFGVTIDSREAIGA